MSTTLTPATAYATTSAPSKQSYTITLATAHDIPALTTIQWAALASNPLIKTLYPHGPTPALITFTQKTYTRALQFPSVRIIKATTNAASGEIVAFAKWIMFPHPEEDTLQQGARGGGGWRKEGGAPSPKPGDVDRRALGGWNDVIEGMRKGVMERRGRGRGRGRGHVCYARRSEGEKCGLECFFGCFAPKLWVLDIIHTHPSHQGLGAAAQLLAWGTARADAQRCPCYVEASPSAYPLFQSAGFHDVAEMEMELNRYKDRKGNGNGRAYGLYWYKHVVMVRMPGNNNEVGCGGPEVPRKEGEEEEAFGKRRRKYWDFGLPSAKASGREGSNDDEGSTTTTKTSSRNSDDDDDKDEGSAAYISSNRIHGRYAAIVPLGGGGTRKEGDGEGKEEELFRAKSQYGVLDCVGGDGE